MTRPAPLLRSLARSLPCSSSSSAPGCRSFSSSLLRRDAPKPASVPVALIAQIRSQRPGTPLSLARSALLATSNDVPSALAWIQQQAAEAGAKKAEKLSARTAEQGLVAVAVLADGTGGVGVRASLVEMRCETDFVARTDEFRELAEGIARSLAFFAEPAKEEKLATLDIKSPALLDMPVVPSPSTVASLAATDDKSPSETIRTSVSSIVSRLGENIRLHRAASISLEPSLPSASSPTFLASSYLHGSKTPADAAKDGVQSGTLGGLLVARLGAGGPVDKTEVKSVLRALARQVVAVPTTSIHAPAEAPQRAEGEPSTALYDQQLITMAPSPKFDFEAGSNVGTVLRKWSELRGVAGEGLEVVELGRWEVGAQEE
ncbi:SPOSA6832_04846 [Sporobolomyces salmonicolor]|uniref:SPOSA6832_04846-mRNA-1:cds n=1 Tax=Sporidiobolus salmonicolor TaxID=5005 RepID=A0A0D6ET67_SPOSA|nr:SPOSA6832_04846 [Sporobolomyces salmonicolor]